VGAAGSQFAGMNSTVIGNGIYSTPVYAPTVNIGVTVIMFHANDAGAKGAFDGAELVAKKGKGCEV
jgi:hypothetical protein